MFYNHLNNPNKQRIAAMYGNTVIKSEDSNVLEFTDDNIDGALGLTKADQYELEKGRLAMPLGSQAHWGDQDYLKTASGWKPVGKLRGHVKANHDHLHNNEDASKDHHAMTQDAGNMDEAAWTAKHGAGLHAKYKAVHEYLNKEKSKIIGKTTAGKDIHDKFDHPGHKLFSGQDHKDAADLHAEIGKKDANHDPYAEGKKHNDAHKESREWKKPVTKNETRDQFLSEAKEDVKNGMDSKTFREKHGSNKNFDDDDHLMLKNMTSSKDVHKKRGFDEGKGDVDITGKDEKIKSDLIELTGKETKQDLIKLIVGVNPYFENKNSTRESDHFKGDSKPELLKHIKILNANKAGGGDGRNISSFYNEEAHSHKNDVDQRVSDYLGKKGITKENMKEHISQEDGMKLLAQWKESLKKDHDGFVGHTKEEKDKAFNTQKDLFDGALNNKIKDGDHKVTDHTDNYQGNKDAKWVRVSHVDKLGVQRISGQAIDKHGGDRDKAIQAGKDSIKQELDKETKKENIKASADNFMKKKGLTEKQFQKLPPIQQNKIIDEWKSSAEYKKIAA